jgi:translation elongation factor P
MKISGNEIKIGMIIEHNNDLWEVLKTQHVKPGKGGAFNQVEMKSINKNTKLNERFRSSDSVERAIVEEIDYNFLYEDKEEFHFIDNKSFEQIIIKKDLIGDKSKFLTEGLEVKIGLYNEAPIKINLPNQIECKIDTTDAAIKGQTVSSSYKPALLKMY